MAETDFPDKKSSKADKDKKEVPVVTLDSMEEAVFVPLDDPGFDLATGGGTPLNILMEIYGPNAGGKTTIAFEIAKSFLKRFPSKFVDYYNYERSIDKFYVRNLLDNDEALIKRFRIRQPDYMEDGAEDINRIIESKESSFIIVDSLAAMQPKSEDEAGMGNKQVGGFKGRFMSEWCRKLGRIIDGSNCTLCFINHENTVLNTGPFSFIKQTITPGGDALKFWASLRISVTVIAKLKRKEYIASLDKDDEVPFGNVVQAQIIKNKFHPPFKKCLMYVIYGRGLDRVRTYIDFGLAFKFLVKLNKLDYAIVGKEENKVRGLQAFRDRLASKESLLNWLKESVSAQIRLATQDTNPNEASFNSELSEI